MSVLQALEIFPRLNWTRRRSFFLDTFAPQRLSCNDVISLFLNDLLIPKESIMKRIGCFLAITVTLALFCGGLSFAADPIKVGVVLPLTGDQAKFGEIERNSFLMALEEINKAGGINGRPIELLIEDDTGKPDV